MNLAERVGFEPTCRLRDKTLSRRPRYDHFGTSPQRCELLADPNRLRLGYGGQEGPPAPRRSRKNACSFARHSAARMPLTTLKRWLNAGCSCTRIADSIAPVLGSGAP